MRINLRGARTGLPILIAMGLSGRRRGALARSAPAAGGGNP